MKVEEFYKTKDTFFRGRTYRVMVYGELTKTNKRDGVIMCRVTTSKDGRNIETFEKENRLILNGDKKRTKSFNMGYAICSPEDEFDVDKGKKICKGRFTKYPITTQNGSFLTHDMVNAIVANEVEYIIKNIENFVRYDENLNKETNSVYIRENKNGSVEYAALREGEKAYWHVYTDKNIFEIHSGTHLSLKTTEGFRKCNEAELVKATNLLHDYGYKWCEEEKKLFNI